MTTRPRCDSCGVEIPDGEHAWLVGSWEGNKRIAAFTYCTQSCMDAHVDQRPSLKAR